MIRRLTTLALVVAVSLSSLAGCGKPFDVKTAPGFVALENQHDFDWRATTPEGVVVGIRVVEDEKRGDLGFWTQAMTLQLRDVSGYALLESTETASADGTKGKLLKFGHDEDAKPYVYWVAIFAAQGRLFVVEAGGQKELFERARPNVEWTMKNVTVRCSGFLAPVLSSHTCNRW
ncbi:MAG TPA: serine/threonine protein kinase [Labilithrix sp.]|nr:serine/threonine protein kinase [Labilithrix sp.]